MARVAPQVLFRRDAGVVVEEEGVFVGDVHQLVERDHGRALVARHFHGVALAGEADKRGTGLKATGTVQCCQMVSINAYSSYIFD